MVLVAFMLVLLAAASFAVGIAASRTSDTLVYLSILFSIGAFVTLAIASFRARQGEREGGGDFTTAPTRTLDETEAHAGPLMGGLDPTQLDMTPTWRRQGRQRWEAAEPPVPDETLEEQLEDEEDEADFEVPVEPVPASGRVDEFRWGLDDKPSAAVEEPTASFTPAFDEFEDDELEDEEEDILDLPEPEPEPEPSAEGSFFDEYDDLTAAEILPFLRALDVEGLEWVRARERSGAKRATVVNQVEQLILDKGGRASTSRKRAAVTKGTAVKKATAARKAAPARRATKATKATKTAKATKKSTRRR